MSQFTELIRFQSPSITENDSGGSSEQYTTYLTTKASVKKKDGYREFQNGADNIISVYEFTCYYRELLENTLEKDDRILYNGKSYRLETWEFFEDGAMFLKIKASAIE